jgi:hypothetical protein
VENVDGKLLNWGKKSPVVFEEAEIERYKIKIAEPRAQPPLLINLTGICKTTSVPNFEFSFYATCFKFKMPVKTSIFT